MYRPLIVHGTFVGPLAHFVTTHRCDLVWADSTLTQHARSVPVVVHLFSIALWCAGRCSPFLITSGLQTSRRTYALLARHLILVVITQCQLAALKALVQGQGIHKQITAQPFTPRPLAA
jgi:hypothetical protein